MNPATLFRHQLPRMLPTTHINLSAPLNASPPPLPQRIWKEAENRANSLERAEAGLGDTLWTARVRKQRDTLDAKNNPP